MGRYMMMFASQEPGCYCCDATRRYAESMNEDMPGWVEWGPLIWYGCWWWWNCARHCCDAEHSGARALEFISFVPHLLLNTPFESYEFLYVVALHFLPICFFLLMVLNAIYWCQLQVYIMRGANRLATNCRAARSIFKTTCKLVTRRVFCQYKLRGLYLCCGIFKCILGGHSQ